MSEQLHAGRRPAGAKGAGPGADADAAPTSRQLAAPAARALQRAKKANEYHARHADWVAQFNELTHGECAGGVRWGAVRAWQQKHWQVNDLLADGLIGPKTLEAAQKLAVQAGGGSDGEKKAGGAEAQHEGGATEDRADPSGGTRAEVPDREATAGPKDAPKQAANNGDAAEASADKPKLDDQRTDVGASGDQEAAAESGGQEQDAAAEDAQLKDVAAPATKTKPQRGEPATLQEFERALARIDELLADFKPPEGKTLNPAIAIAVGRDGGKDPRAVEPAGAMMAHLEAYRAKAKALIEQWSHVGPHERAQFLLTALNELLEVEQVPHIQHHDFNAAVGAGGQFEAATWKMHLDKATFSQKRFSSDDEKVGVIDKAASTVFHEGRHAEQRFGVARLMAEQRPDFDGNAVAAELEIPLRVGNKAFELAKTHPLKANSAEAKQAATISEDVVAHRAEHKSTEILAANLTAAGNAAQALFARLEEPDKASDRWQQYRTRIWTALDAYYQLPSETDAHAAENRLGLRGK